MVSLSTDTWEGAESLLTGVWHGTPATTAGDSVRFLWFTAGFLLGVVTTALGLLWMMTMAVVA